MGASIAGPAGLVSLGCCMARRKSASRARLVGQGEGLHWPELGVDVSVEALLAGRPSAESAASPKRWLPAR